MFLEIIKVIQKWNEMQQLKRPDNTLISLDLRHKTAASVASLHNVYFGCFDYIQTTILIAEKQYFIDLNTRAIDLWHLHRFKA